MLKQIALVAIALAAAGCAPSWISEPPYDLDAVTRVAIVQPEQDPNSSSRTEDVELALSLVRSTTQIEPVEASAEDRQWEMDLILYSGEAQAKEAVLKLRVLRSGLMRHAEDERYTGDVSYRRLEELIEALE